MSKRILFPILAIAALWGAYELNKGDAPLPAADGGDVHETCESDWHMCKDAEDLMEHNRGSVFYRSACQSKANETAEYGPPEWQKGFGIIPFSSFNPTVDIHKEDLLLIEDHALVPNKYGGKERSRIGCFYDLRKGAVERVLIIPPQQSALRTD